MEEEGTALHSSFAVCFLDPLSSFYVSRFWQPMETFSSLCFKGGLLEMPPAFLEKNLSAWPAPLLAATCVPGLCRILSLCYPQPHLSPVSYEHCVPRALQEAFLSRAMMVLSIPFARRLSLSPPGR